MPQGQSTDERWYCKGYDVELSAELLVPNEIEGSYLRFLGVNRLCGGGTVRDY